MFNIVLLEPEIPSNTGNIGRTCLLTGSRLHLIEPMGFILNDKNLKRAGMDYWKDLDVTIYDSWRDFVWKNADRIRFPEATLRDVKYPGMSACQVFSHDMTDSLVLTERPAASESPMGIQGENREKMTGKGTQKKATIWMASTKAPVTHDSAAYRDGDYILFGKESAGIPEKILKDNLETTVRIPMAPMQRSLNLSNSVAVVLYEALRQNRYLDLELSGKLAGGADAIDCC